MTLCTTFSLTTMETSWPHAVQTKKSKFGTRYMLRMTPNTNGSANKSWQEVRAIQALSGGSHGLILNLAEKMQSLLHVVMINRLFSGARLSLRHPNKVNKRSNFIRKLILFLKIVLKISSLLRNTKA